MTICHPLFYCYSDEERFQGENRESNGDIHAYPGDFWRFIPEAVRYLFANMEFDPHLSQLHTDWGRTVSLNEPTAI